jgi:tripartite-type tricarboxylate transporter receptor subunit TctC
MTHIPYKGGAPAIVELMGGHVPVLFSSLGAAAAHVKSGRIKPLAVTSLQRSSMFPDVPAIIRQVTRILMRVFGLES